MTIFEKYEKYLTSMGKYGIIYTSWAWFTKYLTTILQLSYDNTKVAITLQYTSNYSAMLCIRGTSHGPSKSEFYQTAERIELVFGKWASFHPFYTVLKGNSVISKKAPFPLELCPKLQT